MAIQSTSLLTEDEYQTLYAPPYPHQISTTDLILSKQEETIMRRFKRLDSAVYFATSLAFLKLKQTLFNFTYREVTAERRFIMQRYFPKQPTPRAFPSEKDTIVRIENKVLSALGYKRFTGETVKKMIKQLSAQAAQYPRQRQFIASI